MRACSGGLLLAAGMIAATPVAAQTIPFADTEDATLSEVSVGAGNIHPVVTVDARNGDYARGAYDDDDARFGRVPVHLSVGGGIVLRRRADGEGSLFVIGQSSNGFHAPRARERVRPREWYESNNLLGLAWRPVAGLSAAATYAIKASPNGVAGTSHEASLTALYAGDAGLAWWKPRVAVTRRTKGEGGIYTIAGVAPEVPLTAREEGATLTLPVTLGVGWGGFYAAGSGDWTYASGGVSVSQLVRVGAAKASVQAQVLALVRDRSLRWLDAPDGTTAAVVPYATVSLTMAW